MIPYEELVAALDRYVARNGGTPMSAHAPASAAAPSYAPPAPMAEPQAHEVVLDAYDEHHDPDLAHGGEEDATHVGASPGAGAPPPLRPVADEGSNEIELGDVLTDDELT